MENGEIALLHGVGEEVPSPVNREDHFKDHTTGRVIPERSITPEKYGEFLTTFFDLWQKKDIAGMRIREFDAILRGVLGIPQRLCTFSKDCADYYTITPDGGIYLCDCFPPSESFHAASVFDDPLEILQNSTQDAFRSRVKEPPVKCRLCEYGAICNGGCKFHRYIKDPHFGTESYYCESIRRLCSHVTSAVARETHCPPV